MEHIDISNLPKNEARKLILEREQYYLDFIKTDYNINPIPESRLGSQHTEETKAPSGRSPTGGSSPGALMSKIKEGESNPMFGKLHSAESKAKMKKPRTEETRAKMSKKVFVYSKNLISNEVSLYKSFDNYTEAVKHFNCSKGTITYYIDKNKIGT